MTAIPYLTNARLERRNSVYDHHIQALIEKNLQVLKSIEQKVGIMLIPSIKKISQFQYVIESINYWKEKLIRSGYPLNFIESFLITKLLEISAFVHGLESNEGLRSTYQIEDSFSPITRKPNCTGKKNSSICFVVPVLIRNNEMERILQRMLISLYDQKPSTVKIFLIDDGSPHPISVPKSISLNVEKIRIETKSGPANARNIGSKIALEDGFETVIFTDYDLIFPSNWISNLSQMMRQCNGDVFSCISKSLSNTWWDYYHDINGTLNGRLLNGTSELIYATTAVLAVSSNVLKNMKFDTSFREAAGEDIEFCLRIRACGYKIMFLKNLHLFHDYGYNNIASEDAKTFISRSRRYGKGESILISLHPNYYNDLSYTSEIPSVEWGKTDEIPEFPFNR